MQINSYVVEFFSLFLLRRRASSFERQKKMVLRIRLSLALVAPEEKGLFSDSRQTKQLGCRLNSFKLGFGGAGRERFVFGLEADQATRLSTTRDMGPGAAYDNGHFFVYVIY